MSGWIKWEKDLENDPRFRRMVKDILTALNIDPRNATPLQVATHVTLISGALLRMWAHADTYLREDDTFDMSASDMDAYLGIPEFSSICHRDWFGETEDGRVQLPGFHSKNSPEQREKDQTARRVARHRAKQRNATPLPDQTRLDQTRPRPPSKSEGALVEGREGKGREGNGNGHHPSLTFDQAQQLQATYPKGIYRESEWLVVQKLVNQHLANGVEFERILASFQRYRAQVEARGKVGTEFVLSPVKHCDINRPLFDEPFPLPKTKAEALQEANADAGAAWLARQQQESENATG